MPERQQRLFQRGILYSVNGGTPAFTHMNQDQYGSLLQQFIEQEREVSRRELKVVEAKANLTGFQAVYVDGPYVAWETAEKVAGHESRVQEAEKALEEARRELEQLRTSLVRHLPVASIGVLVPLKSTEAGPRVVRVKAVPKEGALADFMTDYTLFIDDREY